jgi:hypothetical protein
MVFYLQKVETELIFKIVHWMHHRLAIMLARNSPVRNPTQVVPKAQCKGNCNWSIMNFPMFQISVPKGNRTRWLCVLHREIRSKSVNLLTGWVTVSFLRRIPLHGFNYIIKIIFVIESVGSKAKGRTERYIRDNFEDGDEVGNLFYRNCGNTTRN